MPLTIGPTGLESPVDKNRKDFTVFSGEWQWAESAKSAAPP